MVKNLLIILVLIGILIIGFITENKMALNSGITIENKTAPNKEDTKVWVSIDPHQCGDYSVPNSIYFDYPNGAFPEYNSSPSLPLSFVVKDNMLELFSVSSLFFGEAESVYQSIVNLSKENNNDFFDKYAKTEIIIYDYRKIDRNIVTCSACGCPVGYSLFLLVSEFDVSKLQKIGYGLPNESITESEKYCEKDEDCILVLSGCPNCFPCRDIKITDPEVIAVNKNGYKCPPKPKESVCIACVGTIEYNPDEDAICVNNKCEKKES